MTPPLTGDERLWRLRQLAQEYNIRDLPEATPLPRQLPTPSTLTTNPKDPDAEKKADDLLKRRRLTNAQGQNGSSGAPKKRPFTLTRKESFASKEIFDTLDALVANAGAPAVAEALVQKLRLAGGDLNRANTKSKTPFSLRRRSVDDLGQEQARILQKAVENGQEEMVAVLAPHADPASLDTALPLALRTGNLKVTEILLQHGANLLQTSEGQFQFRQMCIDGGQADLVGLLLRSEGRPAPDWVSGAMIDAASKGCVDTVMQLSRSVADGNYGDAAAIKEAVSQCRVDIALVILTGNRPPKKQRLSEAFAKVHAHPTMKPLDKIKFTEALLLAGAGGDVVSAALVKACDSKFYDMIDILISNGASIEFKAAMVVENAIKKGDTGLLQLLLSDKATLSPSIAADLTESIPTHISPEDRRIILSILLRKGARGPPVDEALINAVESGDLECVKLLSTGYSSGPSERQSNANYDIKRRPHRAAVADVNHRGGLALFSAVHAGSLSIVEAILAAKPTLETLAAVFPKLHVLDPTDRLLMAKSFLKAGVSGTCVHTALQLAIDEMPPRRDDRLIELLLQNDDANVNVNDEAPLLSAIEQQDVDLLEALLKRRPTTTENATIALKRAISVDNRENRVSMANLLLRAGAKEAPNDVVESIKKVLQEQHTDIHLLEVLLRHGDGDINMDRGSVVVSGNNPQC